MGTINTLSYSCEFISYGCWIAVVFFSFLMVVINYTTICFYFVVILHGILCPICASSLMRTRAIVYKTLTSVD